LKQLFIALLVIIPLGIFSQNDNDLSLKALPYYSYGKGIGLTSPDSLFQFNIRFRMQNRASYNVFENQDDVIEAAVRRLRLRFDGYVVDPKLVYVIQLSFAPDDVGELQEGGNLNVIRDAIIFYRPNAHWNIGFGQTKLPGNRQRINSSGALQLTDRSINNARFNIDRDFGIHLYYLNEFKDKFSYNIKTTISSGEGRNITKATDNLLAYTTKLELFPFGAFEFDGTLFEGDAKREPLPKAMISAVYHANNGAKRTQGTIGLDLFEKRNLQSWLVDAMFKYNGWSLQGAYMNRYTTNPLTTNPLDNTQQRTVFIGEGWDAQASYLFINKYEVIARYSTQFPNKKIINQFPNSKQYSIGVTKYIWEHTLKFQTELTNTYFYPTGNKSFNNWYLRFQVEIGI